MRLSGHFYNGFATEAFLRAERPNEAIQALILVLRGTARTTTEQVTASEVTIDRFESTTAAGRMSQWIYSSS